MRDDESGLDRRSLLAGARDVALYDGAWVEWGAREGAEIVRD